MKMRFEIEYTNSKYKSIIKKHIHMKNISYVVIDSVVYNKPIGDSKETQSFYYFLEKNNMKVTELVSLDGEKYFLKNLKLHSFDSCCYTKQHTNIKYYAINGRLLTKIETKNFIRGNKLKQIKNKIFNDK